MPQFRLTAKVAKYLNVKTLHDPTTTAVPYDDWYVDIKTFRRKKILIFMHVLSRVAVALPVSSLGGIENWKYGFANFLSCILLEDNNSKYEIISKEIHSFITESPLIFTKTNSCSVNSHVQQFSFTIERISHMLDNINLDTCYDRSHKWLRNLVSIDKSKDYSHPIELFDKLIGFSNKNFVDNSNSNIVH